MEEQLSRRIIGIKKIERIGKCKVYDISVKDAEHYVLENGVVTHNTGGMYSANQVFIIGKSQEKEGTDIVGWNFTINIEKSRFVKEKSKLPFLVTYKGGISRWSGLLDIAMESGHVIKPSNGWYSRVDTSTGEIEEKRHRLKDTDSKEFWAPILADQKFRDYIQATYQVSNTALLSDEDIDEEMDGIGDDE